MPTHRKLFRFRILLTLSLAYGCSKPASLPQLQPSTQPSTASIPPVQPQGPRPLEPATGPSLQSPSPPLQSPSPSPESSPSPSGEIKLLSTKEIEAVKASGLIEANNHFSWELFRSLYAEQPKDNLFISPLSAAMALQMAMQGANGETASEMRKALRLEGLDNAALRQSFPLLLRKLSRPAEDITLEIANSFWAAQKYNFYPEFISSIKTDFQAEVASLNFFDPSAPNQINAWTARATHDKIPKVIGEIRNPEELVGFLINAIYFNGSWTQQFDKAETREKPFKLEDGKTVQVSMMRQFSSLPYLSPSDVFPHQGIALPYGKKGTLRMYVFLPSSGKTLADLHTDLQKQDFAQLKNRFYYEGGSLELPRFKLSNSYSLNKSLQTEGMQKAFQVGIADFSRMGPASVLESFYISSVNQFSFVDLDEEGTEAAAVTVVEVGSSASSEPQRSHSMIVDHPFVFLIHDEETGQILFMGSITDPSKGN